MIRIKKLKKTYAVGFIPRKTDVLKGFDLEVESGEVFGFLGPNGAGKTTTIKILVNLIMPTSGSAEINGIDVRDPKARQHVGFLPEQPFFYTYLTGFEFLDYCARLFKTPDTERKKRIEHLLNIVGMEDHRDKALGKYSRGMLQRIGIAQALINDPDLLILDEPLSGLDPVGRREVLNIIYEQKSKGKTIFFSSHILSDAENVCDRVGILNKGSLIDSGDLRTIYENESPLTVAEIVYYSEKVINEYFLNFGEIFSLKRNIYRLRLNNDSDLNQAIVRLIDMGAVIETVQRNRMSLEDIFLKKING
ncbi:ABC transporter ATP-binding protein [candidate division KSB1 bacterium]